MSEINADTHRTLRTGEPEAVYAEGKTPAQTVLAAETLAHAGVRPILITRASREHADAVRRWRSDAVYHEPAGLIVLDPLRATTSGEIVIVTGGTSDSPVASECAQVLAALGDEPQVIHDVGVAGLHRIMQVRPHLEAAKVVIVIAGMEAALGPVVAGLVKAPIIAVPTSVGYGVSQGGITALHALLASCAPGVAVVNIDNGFGAAIVARRILAAGR